MAHLSGQDIQFAADSATDGRCDDLNLGVLADPYGVCRTRGSGFARSSTFCGSSETALRSAEPARPVWQTQLDRPDSSMPPTFAVWAMDPDAVLVVQFSLLRRVPSNGASQERRAGLPATRGGLDPAASRSVGVRALAVGRVVAARLVLLGGLGHSSDLLTSYRCYRWLRLHSKASLLG